MKNKLFIIFNNSNLYIHSKNINKTLCINDSQIKKELINIVNNNDKPEEIILIVDESHFYSLEQVYDKIKESSDNNICTEFKHINVGTKEILNFKSTFFTKSEIEYNGEKIKSSNEIPIHSKYKIIKQSFIWKTEILHKIVEIFKSNDLIINSILPLPYLMLNKYNINDNIYYSICENYTYISKLDSNCNLIFFEKVECGTNDILENISNSFNISLNYSKKLIEKCSYLYLPSNIADYSVDIPISKDQIKTIELKDISLVLKKSWNKLFEQIFLKLKYMKPTIDNNNSINLNYEMYGLTRFINKKFDNNIHIFNTEELDYYYLSNSYENIQELFNKHIKTEILKNEDIEQEIEEFTETRKDWLKNKLLKLVDSKVNAFASFISE